MKAVVRALGIDVGMYKTGVAVGQSLTGTAQPLGVIKSPLAALSAEYFASFVEQWRVQIIVVGEPKLADGTDHPLSEGIARICGLLERRFEMPVHCYDEYLSSHEALKIRSSRQYIDDLAAVVILESWFSNQFDGK